MSDEWVSGDKVDWNGATEMMQTDGFNRADAVVRGDEVFGLDTGLRRLSELDGWRFRRVVTPDPEVVKAGERWMKIVAKLNKHGGLFELFPQEQASLTLARNIILSVVKRDELDAYLAEPKPRRFAWEDVASKPSIELLPGASESVEVDGFRVTVERIE